MKCKYCGKKYVKNENNYLKNLSEFFRKKLEYISACNCLEEGQNRIRDRIIDMCFPVQVIGKSRRGMTKQKFFEFIS